LSLAGIGESSFETTRRWIDQIGIERGERVVLSRARHWDLVTQTDIEREPGRNFPGVLRVAGIIPKVRLVVGRIEDTIGVVRDSEEEAGKRIACGTRGRARGGLEVGEAEFALHLGIVDAAGVELLASGVEPAKIDPELELVASPQPADIVA